MLLHRHLSGGLKAMKIKQKHGVFQSGFTLIELLVVIVILGLLMGLGINSFQSSQVKARDARRKNDLSQIQKALELYYNDHHLYPDLDIASFASGPWQDDNQTLYMKEFPTDPRFGDYYYQQVNSGTAYRLYARLENVNDPEVGVYTDTSCGGEDCNYGVASSNESP